MKRTALDFIVAAETWGITEVGLAKVIAVAERENLQPELFAQIEAVLTRYGKPMDGGTYAQVRDGVAIIPVEGPLFPKANLMTEYSGATSVQCWVQDMARADADPAIKGIVPVFHSPGGVSKGIIEASGIIGGLGKPCVAYVSGLCCSAAYPLAAAANGGIVCSPDAILGSLGVVLSVPPKAKDAPVEIVSSQSPDKRPDIATDQGRAVYQKMVDDLAAVLLARCADLRGTTTEHLQTARGGVLVGQHAIDLGLANDLGSLESVIATLAAPKKTYFLPASPGARTMTPEELKAAHPETYQAVFDAGRKAGSAAEMARIKAIHELGATAPGHEKLVADAMFDGQSTDATLAVQIVKADGALRKEQLAQWREDGGKAKAQAVQNNGDGQKPAEPEGGDGTPPAQAEMPAPGSVFAARAQARAAATQR